MWCNAAVNGCSGIERTFLWQHTRLVTVPQIFGESACEVNHAVMTSLTNLMLLLSGGFLKNYQTCCLDKYATFRLNCRKWLF